MRLRTERPLRGVRLRVPRHEHMFASGRTDERHHWGAWIRTGLAGTKTQLCCLYTTPQMASSSGAALDTTMRAVSAPTVVIIAAGEGTRMRSALPKVLHPLCGRPLILWPVIRGRRRPGPGRSSWSTIRSAGSRTGCPRASRSRSSRSPTARAARSQAAGDPHRPRLDRRDPRGRRAADHRRGDRRARQGARGLRGPGDDGHDGARRSRPVRPRDPRRDRQRREGRRGQGRRGRRDARAARDPRGQHRDLRVRRQGAARRARQARRPTTRRASCTSRTCCRARSRRSRPT